MIQTNQICKVFRRTEKKDKKEIVRDFYAVDHISLIANPGEVLGILGPNGAGKTTLLRMMGNLMEPSEGSVVICDATGQELSNTIDKKKQIGYLSGNTKLYNRFSIREILLLLGNVYQIEKEELQNRINEIIEVLALESFVDNRIEKLSTGQTQRANIARCLIHSPQIYIFDEPTLGLDIISSDAIIEFMKKEREKGKTILYSTHYMEEAQYLCDRIAMMYQGKIIANGTPTELMDRTNTNNLRDTFHKLVEEQEVQNESSDN